MSLLIRVTSVFLLWAYGYHAGSFPARQAVYEMVVKDTLLQTSSGPVHTFSVNGAVPPKMLQIKPNDKAVVSFRNITTHELLLSLPEELVTNPLPKDWVTILPGQTFRSGLRTAKTGVFDYRITRMEQQDNGVSGVIVIKQP